MSMGACGGGRTGGGVGKSIATPTAEGSFQGMGLTQIRGGGGGGGASTQWWI